MSYRGSGITPIKVGDSASTDSFGRLRVSSPTILLDSQFTFDTLPMIWDTSTSGTASITHLPNESSVRMDVGTDSGDTVVRQTRRYWKYRAGHGFRIYLTLGAATQKANLRQRFGLFDAGDGVFLELDGESTVSIIQRTSTSGSPSDSNKVAQGSWNVDPMNGSGPSGVTLDFTKTQILWVDLQWLGVGRVRVGFDVNGTDYVAHEFLNSNTYTTPYMRTASLPVRYEIANTGATASSSSAKQISSSVVWEGGNEDPGCFSTADMGTTTYTATTTLTTILAVRLKSSHIRAFVKPLNTEITNIGSETVRMVVMCTPTVTGSYTWSDPDVRRSIEVATDNLPVTDEGYRISSTYVPATKQNKITMSTALDSYLGLSANIAGESNIIVLAVETISGTAPVLASIQLSEIF